MTSIINQYKKKQNIRNKIRFIRKNLTKKKQHEDSEQITNYILNDNRIKKLKHIGLFFSFDNEINTNYLIKQLLYKEKKVYLPILNPFKKNKILLFSQYTLLTHLKYNKFKIYEPKIEKNLLIPLKKLEILFIPLVAFDNHGNRLGMGGGYYDYTLKNLNHNSQKYLIGLAYDFQKYHKTLPLEHWDISLSEIITPSTHWIWKNKKIIKKINIIYNKKK